MKIKKLLSPLTKKPRLYIKKKFPRIQANRLYKRFFHRPIDWKNPTEFNEKLRWLQFKTDTSKWSLLADKLLVRDYLEKKGYSDMLVKLYGKWDKADDIDFNTLPNCFVIKTNHGSGGVYIIKDKDVADLSIIRRGLSKEITQKYGVETAEPHYFRIKPTIIAEELLEQDGDFSSTLVDYKLYCVHGEPQFCAVMYNRDTYNHRYDVRLYDTDWQDISHLLGNYSHTQIGQTPVPIPKTFNRMKKFCNDLCKEFPFVRMDFYESKGNLYFGEFTFTPSACNSAPLGPEACKMLSEKIQINDKNK